MNHNNSSDNDNNKDGEDPQSRNRRTRYWLALETLTTAIEAEETAAAAFDDARDELTLKTGFRHESEDELRVAFDAAGHTVLEDSTLAQIDLVNQTIDTLWDASDLVREKKPKSDRDNDSTSDEYLRR